MSNITQTIDWEGRNITLTWIELENNSALDEYKPITQAYGICFNNKGEILVLDQQGKGEWTLPGGKVEKGETPHETLTREVMEEADVTLKDVFILGMQKVEDGKRIHYQARFIAKVNQILPQTLDPAKDRIHERKFVPSSQINEFIKWGITGEAIFSTAIKKFISG